MSLMLLFSGFAAFKPVTVNTDSDAIAQAITGAMIIPASNSTVVESQIDAIYLETFSEDTAKGVAEVLALDEIESKSFKRDLVTFLLANEDANATLSGIDYKDISDISIRDIDVTLKSGDKADVEVEFKVYISNFGDDDEEEKARLSVTFEVEELDEDKDFEDAEAEVESNSFELIKFYD